MSLGLVVLEEKLFTRTPTPQSDDIKTEKAHLDLGSENFVRSRSDTN